MLRFIDFMGIMYISVGLCRGAPERRVAMMYIVKCTIGASMGWPDDMLTGRTFRKIRARPVLRPSQRNSPVVGPAGLSAKPIHSFEDNRAASG